MKNEPNISIFKAFGYSFIGTIAVTAGLILIATLVAFAIPS